MNRFTNFRGIPMNTSKDTNSQKQIYLAFFQGGLHYFLIKSAYFTKVFYKKRVSTYCNLIAQSGKDAPNEEDLPGARLFFAACTGAVP